ncbi:MAG: PhoH family protein [Tissierellia bacterium]|nr:PhoH family protein [Tissierellia bacterium]
MREIFGYLDENISTIKEAFDVNMKLSDGRLEISGNAANVNLTKKLLDNLVTVISENGKIDKQSLNYSIDMVLKGNADVLKDLLNETISVSFEGKPIKPKTLGQKRYINSMRDNDIVFCIGPAGTGKTYLAIAMAVKKLKNKEISRVVLTRPAVEAGENLGFLPGDLQEKVDPYLRPIYDALYDILGFESFTRYLEKGIIEVAPLAYMRGRTLDSSFIILDEAQNTSKEQMKMFLTRMGFGSKAVITGDITQIDIPRKKESGLISIQEILKDIKSIDFIHLNKYDVVRHPLIQKIIEAYERYETEGD